MARRVRQSFFRRHVAGIVVTISIFISAGLAAMTIRYYSNKHQQQRSVAEVPSPDPETKIATPPRNLNGGAILPKRKIDLPAAKVIETSKPASLRAGQVHFVNRTPTTWRIEVKSYVDQSGALHKLNNAFTIAPGEQRILNTDGRELLASRISYNVTALGFTTPWDSDETDFDKNCNLVFRFDERYFRQHVKSIKMLDVTSLQKLYSSSTNAVFADRLTTEWMKKANTILDEPVLLSAKRSFKRAFED